MSDDRDELRFSVGAREIYDELTGMRSDVRQLVDDHKDTTRILADHEDRIRGMERWRYALPASAVVGVVGGLVGLLGHNGIL